jgi:hypothetical protein
LFNLSLLSGVFPCVWKESYVVPLFKSGDNRNTMEYHGISILSAIPKHFEKLVYDVITPIIIMVLLVDVLVEFPLILS